MCKSLNNGGIVLCGGRSSRMGESKAALPFGNEAMLQRVVRILSEVVSPVVVAAAQGQSLPELSAEIIIIRDPIAELGPLQGIASGLDALKTKCDAAFICGCDSPLMTASFIQQMLGFLHQNNNIDIVVPKENLRCHPLAAAYRTDVAATANQLIADGQLRIADLLAEMRVQEIDVEQLQIVDPELRSLMNLNSPAEYQAALEIAKLDSAKKY